jgi:uncharacterized membrane protein YecN with MAPEG domain
MRFVDKTAAWLVCPFGIAHLAVGHAVFVEPTERRIWFASAGLLLIVTGLANLAAQSSATRLNSLTAAFGAASILLIAGLLAAVSQHIMAQPQALVLLALGLILTVRRLSDLQRTRRLP